MENLLGNPSQGEGRVIQALVTRVEGLRSQRRRQLRPGSDANGPDRHPLPAPQENGLRLGSEPLRKRPPGELHPVALCVHDQCAAAHDGPDAGNTVIGGTRMERFKAIAEDRGVKGKVYGVGVAHGASGMTKQV
jgi:hypothetical protein